LSERLKTTKKAEQILVFEALKDGFGLVETLLQKYGNNSELMQKISTENSLSYENVGGSPWLTGFLAPK